jgi:hypothetical protein
MAIKVKCPTCGAKLKAPDAAAGRPLDCPHCSQAVPVPPQAAAPPPSVAGHGESSAVEGRLRESRSPAPRHRPDFDQLAEDFEERRARVRTEAVVEDTEAADRLGAVSLGLGLTAVACLVMGCFTCGLTYWLAAPIAVAGAGCAAFSQSRLRVVGLAANLLILIPAAVAFHAAWTTVTAPAPEPQPFLR